MSTWGGGWFTAGSQANNSNKPFLVSRGFGETILKRRFKALQINKKKNMNYFFFSGVFWLISVLSSIPQQREERRGPIDKILFWCKCCKFSWLCLADSPSPTDPHPSGTVAWCQTDLPSPPRQPPAILPNWEQSIMKLSPTICVMYLGRETRAPSLHH